MPLKQIDTEQSPESPRRLSRSAYGKIVVLGLLLVLGTIAVRSTNTADRSSEPPGDVLSATAPSATTHSFDWSTYQLQRPVSEAVQTVTQWNDQLASSAAKTAGTYAGSVALSLLLSRYDTLPTDQKEQVREHVCR